MCENCFNTEIESFPTEKGWLTFDVELTKKLVSQQMRSLKFKPDGIRGRDGVENIYQCNTCYQKWKLKDPDNAIRGYFLKAK